jgi:hypothetical protein
MDFTATTVGGQTARGSDETPWVGRNNAAPRQSLFLQKAGGGGGTTTKQLVPLQRKRHYPPPPTTVVVVVVLVVVTMMMMVMIGIRIFHGQYETNNHFQGVQHIGREK